MDVREMMLADVFTIAEMEREIFSDPWSVASCRSAIENKNIFSVVAFDEESGRITGYAFLMVAADEAEILRIAVAEDYRRLGVGNLIMNEILQFGADDGYIFFFLEVRASNLPAIALYRKWGFSPTGRRVEYYKDPVEDALIMELELSDE